MSVQTSLSIGGDPEQARAAMTKSDTNLGQHLHNNSFQNINPQCFILLGTQDSVLAALVGFKMGREGIPVCSLQQG